MKTNVKERRDNARQWYLLLTGSFTIQSQQLLYKGMKALMFEREGKE